MWLGVARLPAGNEHLGKIEGGNKPLPCKVSTPSDAKVYLAGGALLLW